MVKGTMSFTDKLDAKSKPFNPSRWPQILIWLHDQDEEMKKEVWDALAGDKYTAKVITEVLCDEGMTDVKEHQVWKLRNSIRKGKYQYEQV